MLIISVGFVHQEIIASYNIPDHVRVNILAPTVNNIQRSDRAFANLIQKLTDEKSTLRNR